MNNLIFQSRCVALLLVVVVQQATAFSVLPAGARSSSHRQNAASQQQQTALGATWSNGQAVQDYQNFLSSGKQELDLTDDGASVIIQPQEGPNTQLGETLLKMGLGDDLVVKPGMDLPDQLGDLGSEYPIYITLPPYQLEEFFANLPESYKDRIDDFVFFSGGLEYGNIEDVLKDRGYCRDSMTQVLISGLRVEQNQFIDTKAVIGVDANGENKLAGECAATGKWAGSIAARLERHNVFCRTDFYREWRRRMWERSVYDAVFHLIGAVRDEPTTLQDVALYYSAEVADIVWEMSQLLRGWRAITLMYGFEDRLLSIGESAGSEQQCTLVNEMYPYIWGNQVVLESKAYVEYLQYGQTEKGLLQGIELPNRSDGDYVSKMLKGNLRADGLV